MITQTLKLNLIPGQVLPRVNVSQYDAGTRTLQMLLYNGDQAFNIPVGYGGFVQGTKPDRTGFQYAATVTEGSNVVTLVVTQQMAAVSGEVTCELVIANGDDRIATVNFILYVEPAALADDTVISDTELPLIEEAAELAQRIDGIAADVEADADRAEAAVEHYPYIGANGNWYVFDLQTEQFVDTTIAATGPQGPTGPTGPTGPQGPTGPTGNGIVSITKTGTSGLVDTYTITFTDGTTTTFTVTNGQDGQGSGDMTKAVYDSTNAVADAGGIASYVSGAISGKANTADLGTAAYKNSTNAVTSGSTDLVESGAVYSAVDAESTARANADNEFTSEIADMNNILGSKNLLNLPASRFPAVQYGITVQKNSDGSLSISGTNSDNTRHGITIYSGDLDEGSKLQIGTSYTLNGVKSTDGCFLQIGGIDNGTYTSWGETNSEAGLEFEATASEFRVYLIIPANGSVNGTIYPMVRPASVKSAVYAPYAKTNKELTDSVKETNDLFTPVRVLSTSYNGLNIEVYKSLNNHAIRINISGTITTAIPIASAYVAIADISNLDLGRLDSYILFNSSVGGQIRVNRLVSGSSNGKIELGYARKFSEDSTIDLPVGMSIFITLSFIK